MVLMIRHPPEAVPAAITKAQMILIQAGTPGVMSLTLEAAAGMAGLPFSVADSIAPSRTFCQSFGLEAANWPMSGTLGRTRAFSIAMSCSWILWALARTAVAAAGLPAAS